MAHPRARSVRDRPLVLIADHDEHTRAMYAFALSANGFDVAIADVRTDLRTRATELLPDIIVAELDGRGGQDWTRVHDLTHDPRTVRIPVVLLTTLPAPTVRERAEREGCAALCVKPCTPDVLAVGLRAVLERYAALG
jgi:CheY-like chemotaxis protein